MENKLKSIKDIEKYLDEQGVKNPKERAIKIAHKYNSIKQSIQESALQQLIEAFKIEDMPNIQEVKVTILKESKTDIYSYDILMILNNWAKRIRKEVFGSEEVPFESYEKAIEWIESIQNDYFENYKEIYSKKEILFEEKYNELKDLIKKGEAIYYGGFIGCLNIHLPYKKVLLDEIEGLLGAHYTLSKELKTLAYETHEMSISLRIDQYDLLRYLLSGIKPELTRYQVTTLGGPRKTVEIKINVSDLTFEEIKDIYDIYRKELNVKKKKRLTEKHERIINLIKELGEPPEERGRSQYYQRAIMEWNNRYLDKYTDWRLLYKAYENIKIKLNRM